MLFSKSPVKDVSQKIKPPQASIKNLKFERKKDFDSFLTYIKRETKTLDDIKLPKTAEVERKPFPLLGALLGFGALGLLGMFGGRGSEPKGDTTGQEFSEKDSNIKLTSLSLASMKAFSNRRGRGKNKKGDDKTPDLSGAPAAKTTVRETQYQKNRLKKTRDRILNIKKKRYTTRTKGTIELKGEALLRKQKLEDRMTKAYNRNKKQFPLEFTRKERQLFAAIREENKLKKINKILANLMDSPAYAEAEAAFEEARKPQAAKNKNRVVEEVPITVGGRKIKKRDAPRVPITSGGGPSEGFGGAPVTSGTGGSKSKGTGSVKISFGSNTPLATPENIKAEADLQKLLRSETKRKNKGNQTNRMSKGHGKNKFRFPKKSGGVSGGFPYSTFRMSDEGRNFKKTFMDFYKVKNNTLRVISFMSGLMGGSPLLTSYRILIETSINDLLYNPVADGTLEANIEMMEANRAAQIENLSKLILAGEIDPPDTGFGEYPGDAFATPPSFQPPKGGSTIPFNYSGVLTQEDEYRNLAEELIKLRLGER